VAEPVELGVPHPPVEGQRVEQNETHERRP
jgi:hypothetical protein